jgi:hypothetical protein
MIVLQVVRWEDSLMDSPGTARVSTVSVEEI